MTARVPAVSAAIHGQSGPPVGPTMQCVRGMYRP